MAAGSDLVPGILHDGIAEEITALEDSVATRDVGLAIYSSEANLACDRLVVRHARSLRSFSRFSATTSLNLCKAGDSRMRFVAKPHLSLLHGPGPSPGLVLERLFGMNNGDLAEALASSTGLTKADARKYVDAVFSVVADAAAKGDEVSLNGFGKFKVKDSPAREGRNPSTGAPIQIAASRKLTFSSAKALKDKLNG